MSFLTTTDDYLEQYIQNWPVRDGKTRRVNKTEAKLFLRRCGLIGFDFEGVEHFNLDYIVAKLEGAIEKNRSSERSPYQEKNDEWTKGTFEIRHRDLSKHPVRGYVCGNYGIYEDSRLHEHWQITDIPSGLQIDSSNRLEDAKAKVRVLEQWRSHYNFEWTEAQNDGKTSDLARQARDKARETVGHG